MQLLIVAFNIKKIECLIFKELYISCHESIKYTLKRFKLPLKCNTQWGNNQISWECRAGFISAIHLSCVRMYLSNTLLSAELSLCLQREANYRGKHVRSAETHSSSLIKQTHARTHTHIIHAHTHTRKKTHAHTRTDKRLYTHTHTHTHTHKLTQAQTPSPAHQWLII